MRIVDELEKAAVLDLGQIVIDVIAAQRIGRDLIRLQVLAEERVYQRDVRGDDFTRMCAGEALIGNDDRWIQAAAPALISPAWPRPALSSGRHVMTSDAYSVL